MEARQISAVSVGPVGEVWRCGGGAVVKAAQIRRMKQVEGSGSRQMWTQCVLVLVDR